MPKLQLTTITFGLQSFRLPDDLILAATSFSGIAAFIELVDTDAAANLPDPLKARLQEVVRQARAVLVLVALTLHLARSLQRIGRSQTLLRACLHASDLGRP